MVNFIICFIAFFITIPIIASLIVYMVSMIVRRNKRKAIQRMVNWTTFLYIFAVSVMLFLIFDRNLTGVILVMLLIMLALIIFIQWKTKQDVEIMQAVKLLWRISFLLFFFLYGFLLLAGILQELFV